MSTAAPIEGGSDAPARYEIEKELELLADDLEETRKQFVFVKFPTKEGKKRTDLSKEYKCSKGPALVVVDPANEEKPIVKMLKSFKKIGKDLQKILDKRAK